MNSGVNNSQFYMWRTLFAVAHADNIVTREEVEFMAHILEDIDFSPEQTEILKDDIVNAKDIEQMFNGITEQEDRVSFFDFARDLVWVDGDFGSEEQSVMIKLFRDHFKKINVDDLVGKVTLELEDDPVSRMSDPNEDTERGRRGLRSTIYSFRRRFLEIMGKDEI